MHFNIGISPCPNDTFIFENIFTKKITLDGVTFQFHFYDIEELNHLATQGKMDIIKISYAHYFNVKNNYDLLRSGGAMGYGVGPLLLKKEGKIFDPQHAKVAIPGIHTTANFLLSYLFPTITAKSPMPFNVIEQAVLNEEFDAGLVIHESRFTYQQKGLELIADLGDRWQQQLNLPIPLGCIIIKKMIPKKLQIQIQQLISASIANYDVNGEPILSAFIKSYAQEMDEDVMLQHIKLYVNEFSKDIGAEGENVIALMGKTLASSKDK
jgi:1,4-dihydroxy-6-naphthoate synthase